MRLKVPTSRESSFLFDLTIEQRLETLSGSVDGIVYPPYTTNEASSNHLAQHACDRDEVTASFPRGTLPSSDFIQQGSHHVETSLIRHDGLSMTELLI